jgi:hypothetical protein
MAVTLRPGQPAVMAALDRRAKPGQTIALVIRREDVSYPFFGGGLDRRVIFVTPSNARAVRAHWIVTAPGEEGRVWAVLYEQSWTRVFDKRGWKLFYHS